MQREVVLLAVMTFASLQALLPQPKPYDEGHWRNDREWQRLLPRESILIALPVAPLPATKVIGK
ncbi:MAG: hypothetical protein A2854_02455 [Parcubacteria group bacterium RIFCSPHIGHO2_01_FULL_56_18]|nr:MAG: hypothetical protein A2854_02455 [Parcubacteria group bacterium RIFCSPHIGHO2_01_FULL_56_18]